MKFDRFERRSAALSSLALFAACTLAAGSSSCKLELSDGGDSGSGGERSATIAAGNGGATPTAGGAPNASAGAASTGQGAAGNSATEGGSADAGQSGSSSPASTNREDCTDPDHIPNDDRQHAVNFGSGATLCVSNDQDSDWFYVDTPSDGRAHVIKLDISETDESWVDIYVTADKDGSAMGRIHPSQRGLKLSSFATVGPGTRTYFQVEGFTNNTDTTTIDVTVTAEADEHEPNNDRASATPIQPATEISAQLILPYVSQTDQQVQDIYEVDLAAGEHTFEMKSVPSDLSPAVQVSDSADTIITTHNHGANRGAKFSFEFTASKAGTYYFQVDSWIDLGVVYSGTEAASFLQPYKFQID